MKSPWKRTGTARTADPAPSLPSGASVYSDFLAGELAVQNARKASFEQRGIAVVTTAGTLVTLLFGLAALSTSVAKAEQLSGSTKTALAYALVLFVVSAILALLTNLPIGYQAVPADEIRDRLREKPGRDADAARRDIALTQVKVLRDAKRKNSLKGWCLFGALVFEVVAVGFVMVAIFEVIHP
jgi:hypothetical protein